MSQKSIEELYLFDGRRRFTRHAAVPNSCLLEAGFYYAFELHRKRATFADIPIEQFWMHQNSLYGREGSNPRNFDVIVEYYGALCRQAGTDSDDEVLDSYILAKMLPYVRRNGSRRVFNDSILTSPRHVGERASDLVADLEMQLRSGSSRGEALDLVTFQRNTIDLLGHPEFSEAVQHEYHLLAAELLGRGRRAVRMWGKSGLTTPIATLRRWMASFARRRGNEDKKLALDALCYECRAAMHRCYSATWFHLLSHLQNKYELDQATVQFHRLMHFDVMFPSDRPDARFHLFNGHIFALHPGLGLFLQTPTGGRLVGDYLRAEEDGPFCRLLHGIWIALIDYDSRSERYRFARSRQGENVADPDEVAAGQSGRRDHRVVRRRIDSRRSRRRPR